MRPDEWRKRIADAEAEIERLRVAPPMMPSGDKSGTMVSNLALQQGRIKELESEVLRLKGLLKL